MIVDKAIDARVGHIVIEAVNGEPVCKRLEYVGRQIVLGSENSRYAPRFIMEGSEFSVWGVVTYSLRRHVPMSCIS